jgi:hypothetical protein
MLVVREVVRKVGDGEERTEKKYREDKMWEERKVRQERAKQIDNHTK